MGLFGSSKAFCRNTEVLPLEAGSLPQLVQRMLLVKGQREI